MLNHIKYLIVGESNKAKLYNFAAESGKADLGMSTIIYIFFALLLFTIAYFVNKYSNNNIKDITGTVSKINTPSGTCNTNEQQQHFIIVH